jgi:hypothetical protein
MLNRRSDPDYERRMHAPAIRIQQTENEILRVRSDSEQIEKEIEQLRCENARLTASNARTRRLISCVDQLCFPLESSSIPTTSTEPDFRPSSP